MVNIFVPFVTTPLPFCCWEDQPDEPHLAWVCVRAPLLPDRALSLDFFFCFFHTCRHHWLVTSTLTLVEQFFLNFHLFEQIVYLCTTKACCVSHLCRCLRRARLWHITCCISTVFSRSQRNCLMTAFKRIMAAILSYFTYWALFVRNVAFPITFHFTFQIVDQLMSHSFLSPSPPLCCSNFLFSPSPIFLHILKCQVAAANVLPLQFVLINLC